MTKSVEHTVKFPALESRLLRHIQIKLFLRLVGFESQAQRSRNFLNPLVDRNIVPEVWMVDIHHNVPGVFFSEAVELLPELNFPLAFPSAKQLRLCLFGPTPPLYPIKGVREPDGLLWGHSNFGGAKYDEQFPQTLGLRWFPLQRVKGHPLVVVSITNQPFSSARIAHRCKAKQQFVPHKVRTAQFLSPSLTLCEHGLHIFTSGNSLNNGDKERLGALQVISAFFHTHILPISDGQPLRSLCIPPFSYLPSASHTLA